MGRMTEVPILTYQSRPGLQVSPATLSPYLFQCMTGIPVYSELSSQRLGGPFSLYNPVILVPCPLSPFFKPFALLATCCTWFSSLPLSPHVAQGYVHCGLSQTSLPLAMLFLLSIINLLLRHLPRSSYVFFISFSHSIMMYLALHSLI